MVIKERCYSVASLNLCRLMQENTVKLSVYRTRFLSERFMLIVVISNDGHITHNRFKAKYIAVKLSKQTIFKTMFKIKHCLHDLLLLVKKKC